MKPLVSILIPARNAEKWINDTLRSAVDQTWARKEIIVVDDGSTDRTLAIAGQFASKEISVISQRHQGAAAARNAAFSLSQGDYIQWLDADDLLDPGKISKQMDALEDGITERTLLSSAWGRFMYRVDRAVFEPTLLWNDLSPNEWCLRKLEHNLFMQTGTWLVSRKLTEAIGPWDIRLSLDDDGEYLARLISASDGIKFIREAKVFYRQSGSDRLSSIGRSSKKLESQFLSNELQIRYLRALDDSERVRRACLAFLQRWLIYFYPERIDLVKRSEELALQLGGRLERPRLSWKYAWIQKLFGWQIAKRTQLLYNECKSSIRSSWDAALFRYKI